MKKKKRLTTTHPPSEKEEIKVFIDTSSNFHPYECGGNCIHCNREKTDNHDPDKCALCNYGNEFLKDNQNEAML